MDPLSITAGVVALLTAAIKVSFALKDFQEGVAVIDAKVNGLLFDVENFTLVIRTIKETLEQENVQASLQATGHIGNHFKNLHASIDDGQRTLLQLQATLDRVNKNVSLLDGPRKHLRLKGAAEEIMVYQLQIRSCRDTLHLSLQALTLWNQVSFQESNDRILPNLNELHQAIRHLAIELNSRIANLQETVESNSRNDELQTLENSKRCVQSAATVISSASTALGLDQVDRESIVDCSEFGDLFPSERNETMERWISSHTVYEFGEAESENTLLDSNPEATQLPDVASDGDLSDSDAELEGEMIQAMFERGKVKFEQEDYPAAERLFQNCLNRLASSASLSSSHHTKIEITNLLIGTYHRQKKWHEMQPLLMDRLAQTARGSANEKEQVLSDMLMLTEVLHETRQYAEALLYGRKALKVSRRMGPSGSKAFDSALTLLIRICSADENPDEAEAYSAILAKSLTGSVPTPKDSSDQSVSGGFIPNTDLSAGGATVLTQQGTSTEKSLEVTKPRPLARKLSHGSRTISYPTRVARSPASNQEIQAISAVGVTDNGDRPNHSADSDGLLSGQQIERAHSKMPQSNEIMPPRSSKRSISPGVKKTSYEQNLEAPLVPLRSVNEGKKKPPSSEPRSHAPKKTGPDMASPIATNVVALIAKTGNDFPEPQSSPIPDAGLSLTNTSHRSRTSSPQTSLELPSQSSRGPPRPSPPPHPRSTSLANSSSVVHHTMASTQTSAMSDYLGPLRLAVVGPANVGKTSLIRALEGLPFSTDGRPTHKQREKPTIISQNTIPDVRRKLEIILLSRFPESNARLDVVLLCFSFADEQSLGDMTKTLNKGACRKMKRIVLVGLQEDVFFSKANLLDQRGKIDLIKGEREKVLAVSKYVNAHSYVQCSARTGEGVKAVFKEAVSAYYLNHPYTSRLGNWIDRRLASPHKTIDAEALLSRITQPDLEALAVYSDALTR